MEINRALKFMNSNLDFSTDALTALLQEEDVKPTVNSKLVVFNDDYNTFDWVIESLIDICGHTMAQGEQCALTGLLPTWHPGSS